MVLHFVLFQAYMILNNQNTISSLSSIIYNACQTKIHLPTKTCTAHSWATVPLHALMQIDDQKTIL